MLVPSMMTARRAISSLLMVRAAQVQRGQHQPGVQRRHQAQGQFIDAKSRHADRLKPIQVGRFVKKGNAVEPWGQPVTADQHPAANFAITPLVGHGNRSQRGQQQQRQP